MPDVLNKSTCSRCGQDNPATAQFCVRCHLTLRITCPACGHVQESGGVCGKCGVIFAKYVAMLLAQKEVEALREHERTRARQALWKQALLFPVTGGISLVRYLLEKARNG
jgi:hypothetical protein